ncbi:MAG: polysaccharide deacetylase family protein [Candidatus Omnitrophica bacterium]|nr:polysaccharide deacetylase family protein [Candidatus Omnitrophota bacterium]
MVFFSIVGFVVLFIVIGGFCVFFDQAILARRGTIYRIKTDKKRVLLTFDDGPSPDWTPKILDELKKENISAVFFMIGHHVQKYPDIARQVASEGHTIGNHGYAHSVMFYYTPAEIEEEIQYTEHVIREATGQTTKYFRPPKAWLRRNIKKKVKSMGYETILWSLNSKDWVSFNHKSIVKYISGHIKNGDILLFHDSGNVTTTEGGNRRQTVKSISLLARALREKGFEFVSIEELINGE